MPLAPPGGAAAAAAADPALSHGFVWSWSCQYSFRPRDCPARALSASLDGSVLAAAADNVVSLWDPARVALKASFVAPGTSAYLILAPI